MLRKIRTVERQLPTTLEHLTFTQHRHEWFWCRNSCKVVIWIQVKWVWPTFLAWRALPVSMMMMVPLSVQTTLQICFQVKQLEWQKNKSLRRCTVMHLHASSSPTCSTRRKWILAKIQISSLKSNNKLLKSVVNFTKSKRSFSSRIQLVTSGSSLAAPQSKKRTKLLEESSTLCMKNSLMIVFYPLSLYPNHSFRQSWKRDEAVKANNYPLS